MGVKKELRAQRRTMQEKMPDEILDHFVRYLRQTLTVKSWKGLEYDWVFWVVFVEWCLGQE